MGNFSSLFFSLEDNYFSDFVLQQTYDQVKFQLIKREKKKLPAKTILESVIINEWK